MCDALKNRFVNFKRALEARIKTVRMFDRESVAAEWVKVRVEHVEQE